MQDDVVVIAQFPDPGAVIDDWYSRVRTVDTLLAPRQRTYVNFGEHHQAGRDDDPIDKIPGVRQFNLNAEAPEHRAIFDRLFSAARLVYCHTVQLAVDILPWFPSPKIVVDVHGAAPEEEALLGRSDREIIFAEIERQVMEQCSQIVVVTGVMEQHLRAKYRDTQANFIQLPIYDSSARFRSEGDRAADWERARVVYAGGVQSWENVDAMLLLARACEPIAETLFLSAAPDAIKDLARNLGVNESVYQLDTLAKNHLPAIYARQNFGLVLRDDTPMNRVMCPTKLVEYMDFGIVLIVRTPYLGDFAEEGYLYMTEDEMSAGFLPDRRTQTLIRARNYEVIKTLAARFAQGAAEIRSIAGT